MRSKCSRIHSRATVVLATGEEDVNRRRGFAMFPSVAQQNVTSAWQAIGNQCFFWQTLPNSSLLGEVACTLLEDALRLYGIGAFVGTHGRWIWFCCISTCCDSRDTMA